MQTIPLKVEIYSDITEEGIWSTTYLDINDDVTKMAESTLTWDDWIEQQVEYYTVPNKQYIPYEDIENLKDVFSIVKTLRYAADVLEERLMALDGFDRKAWIEAGGIEMNTPRDVYLKPMSELLK